MKVYSKGTKKTFWVFLIAGVILSLLLLLVFEDPQTAKYTALATLGMIVILLLADRLTRNEGYRKDSPNQGIDLF